MTATAVAARPETVAPAVGAPPRRLLPRDHHCAKCGRYVLTSWAPEVCPPATFYALGKCEACRAWRRFAVETGRPAARYGPILID